MGNALVRGESELRLDETLTRRKFIHTTLIAGAALSVPGLLLSSTASATDETQAVLAAFKKAVDAFNNKQPDVLSQSLDPKVELRKIHTDHKRPVINGRANVIDYLKNAWNGSPPVKMVFTPRFDSKKREPDVKFHGPNRSAATVTGLSCWSDDDGDGPDGELRYNFQFKNEGGTWLITSLYGQYTHNPPKACSS